MARLRASTAPAPGGPIQCLWGSLGRLNPRRYLPTAAGGYTDRQMDELGNYLPGGPLTALGHLNPRRYLPRIAGGYTSQQLAEPQNRLAGGPLTALGRLNPRRYLPRIAGGYTLGQLAEPQNRSPAGPLDLLGRVNPRLYAPTWLGGHSHQHLLERRIRDSTLPESVKAALVPAHRGVAGAGDARRPNDLSVAEHDRLVTLLEKIHAGRANLRIEPEPAQPDYPLGNEAEVRQQLVEGTLSDLVRISQTRQGRGLLHSLAQGETDPGGRNRVVLNPYDRTVAPGASPLYKDRARDQRQPVRVLYSPPYVKLADHAALAQYQERVADNPWEVPTRTDVSLFHELVHASHIQTGRYLAKDDLVTSENTPGAADVDLPERGGVAVSREEYKTVGLGGWEDEPFTDRKYREERQRLGEDVPDRTYYTHRRADGRPWV